MISISQCEETVLWIARPFDEALTLVAESTCWKDAAPSWEFDKDRNVLVVWLRICRGMLNYLHTWYGHSSIVNCRKQSTSSPACYSVLVDSAQMQAKTRERLYRRVWFSHYIPDGTWRRYWVVFERNRAVIGNLVESLRKLSRPYCITWHDFIQDGRSYLFLNGKYTVLSGVYCLLLFQYIAGFGILAARESTWRVMELRDWWKFWNELDWLFCDVKLYFSY